MICLIMQKLHGTTAPCSTITATANQAGGTPATEGVVHPFTAGAERGLPVRTRPDQRRGTNFFPMERTGCYGLLRLRFGRE